jgi:hypothetical protein
VPTKLFEYMAMGLPVVASDPLPIHHFLEWTEAGLLVAPDSAYAHAGQMTYLVRRQTLFDKWWWQAIGELRSQISRDMS